MSTNADLPPEVAALGGEVERTSRRVEEVDILVRQLAVTVEELAAHVADAASSPSRVRSWLEIDDAELARIVLADLVVWLEQVYLRYRRSELPTCWMWHPDVVEELWVLRNTHRDAVTGRDASWGRLQYWHDRWRPGVVARINEAIGSCELGLHVEGGDEDRGQPVVAFAEAADQVAGSWVDRRLAPYPTGEQLREAKRLQRTF